MINKLVKLANHLDSVGLYAEANIIDDIIKLTANEHMDLLLPHTTVSKKDNPIMKKYIQQLDELRSLFGLQPGGFDAQLSKKLFELNKKYPGTWTPNSNQKLNDLLNKVKGVLSNKHNVENKTTSDALKSRDPGAVEVHPSMKELFPLTKF